jgi:hypothetical protein
MKQRSAIGLGFPWFSRTSNSKSSPRYHDTKSRRVTSIEWHGIYSDSAAELPGLLKYRNGANQRAERCAGTLHVRAFQRCGHFGDGRSVGFLRWDLPASFACCGPQLVSQALAGVSEYS